MDGRSPEAEESAKEWLDRARLDAENALALYDSYPSAYDNVGFLCQQATEKLLKAYLVAHSHSFPKTHDIRTLL
ncbi:MAG: HEPN domain-containing protein, partial [Armatimonadota bacterium]